MYVPFMASLATAVLAAVDTPLDLQRCEKAKMQNPALLAVVSIVSSTATEFDRRSRSRLRRRQFRQAQSLDTRTVFLSSTTLTTTTSLHAQRDHRPVCVQSIFVLSPWLEYWKPGSKWSQIVPEHEWRQIIAESNDNKDLLIAPTIIDSRTRARELMYVLEWSRHTVPWADYIVSVDTNIQIHWPRMISLFPPPVPRASSGHALWQLGSSDSSTGALFFQDVRSGTLRKCVDVAVSAFSRDLVRQMTDLPFSTQILYALRHPFRTQRTSCKHGNYVVAERADIDGRVCWLHSTTFLTLAGSDDVDARGEATGTARSRSLEGACMRVRCYFDVFFSSVFQ